MHMAAPAEQQPPADEHEAPHDDGAEDGDDYFDDSDDEWAKPAPATEDGDAPSAPREMRATDCIHDDDDDERELAGDRVEIAFKLPDGSVVERPYRMGHTVALLKAHLEDMDGLPYDRMVLKLGDVVCIDPLSLNDLPFKADAKNIVDVELA